MADQRIVGDYFDGQAAEYFDERPGMKPFHRRVARQIESELAGEVLSVGGLWFDARTDSSRFQVTVVDVSAKMLAAQGSGHEYRVIGDARRLPFGDGVFAHVVLPLVLHHVAGRDGREARRGVRQVLAEVNRVLVPGGKVWINEFCVPAPVYALELLLAPATRGALAMFKTPLVVMHSARFYTGLLESLGFESVARQRVTSPGVKPTDLITPILGMSRLRIPRFLYPVVPTLITARRR